MVRIYRIGRFILDAGLAVDSKTKSFLKEFTPAKMSLELLLQLINRLF